MARDHEAYGKYRHPDLTGTTLTLYGKQNKTRTVEITQRLADAEGWGFDSLRARHKINLGNVKPDALVEAARFVCHVSRFIEDRPPRDGLSRKKMFAIFTTRPRSYSFEPRSRLF
jgi:hypothetical protein